MQFVDFHCDTLMRAFLQKRTSVDDFPEAMVDAQRLVAGGALAQWFAIYLRPESEMPFGVSDEAYIDGCLEIFHNTITESSILAPAYGAAEVLTNRKNGKVSALLSFEDGRAVTSIERLECYYAQGLRMIGLTWNGANCLAHPNSADAAKMALGLTNHGRDVVRRMNELGMLVDVSHLSDGGFHEVADIAKKPFIASHSNCRSLADHPRNLTDEMIKILADQGGIMGLNLCIPFLETGATRSTLERMSVHVRHMINTGGIDCAAIGADLDGIDGDLEIPTCAHIPLLFDQLHKDGLSDDALEKIGWRNALRVMSAALGG